MAPGKGLSSAPQHSMLIPAASARVAVEFFGSPVMAGVSCSSGSPPGVSGMLLCQEALAQAKRPTAEMQVVAGTCTPPRARTHSSTHSATRGTVRALAAAVTRRKGKRRRSGGGGGSDDSGDDDNWQYDPYSLNWGGPGDTGGFGGFKGGGGGSGGSGGRGGSSGPYSFNCSEWDFFGNTLYEGMWVWQLLCAMSLMQALHFLLCPGAQEAMQEGEGVGVPPVGC